MGKPKENVVKDDSEIRITAIRSVSAYVTRAATVFNELEKPFITITATGNALSKAVTLAEVVKRRFKGFTRSLRWGPPTSSMSTNPWRRV